MLTSSGDQAVAPIVVIAVAAATLLGSQENQRLDIPHILLHLREMAAGLLL